jgi:hypothetical protein
MVQFLKLLLISGIVENMLFLDFTTIWIFPFYYLAWMPSENDDDDLGVCDFSFKFWVKFWWVLKFYEKKIREKDFRSLDILTNRKLTKK